MGEVKLGEFRERLPYSLYIMWGTKDNPEPIWEEISSRCND
jgi:hypothetical protein